MGGMRSNVVEQRFLGHKTLFREVVTRFFHTQVYATARARNEVETWTLVGVCGRTAGGSRHRVR